MERTEILHVLKKLEAVVDGMTDEELANRFDTWSINNASSHKFDPKIIGGNCLKCGLPMCKAIDTNCRKMS